MHRDLSYYGGIRAKTCHEYKLHENKYENHANSSHIFSKRSPKDQLFVAITWKLNYRMTELWMAAITN